MWDPSIVGSTRRAQQVDGASHHAFGDKSACGVLHATNAEEPAHAAPLPMVEDSGPIREHVDSAPSIPPGHEKKATVAECHVLGRESRRWIGGVGGGDQFLDLRVRHIDCSTGIRGRVHRAENRPSAPGCDEEHSPPSIVEPASLREHANSVCGMNSIRHHVPRLAEHGLCLSGELRRPHQARDGSTDRRRSRRRRREYRNAHRTTGLPPPRRPRDHGARADGSLRRSWLRWHRARRRRRRTPVSGVPYGMPGHRARAPPRRTPGRSCKSGNKASSSDREITRLGGRSWEASVDSWLSGAIQPLSLSATDSATRLRCPHPCVGTRQGSG